MHYFLYVLAAPQTPPGQLEDVVGAALAPFDENVTVPTWRKACWCIGEEARKVADAEAVRQHGSLADMRRAFEAHAVAQPEGAQESIWESPAWEAARAAYAATREAAFKAHPLREAVDPTCSECQGSGAYDSDASPKGYWDWWVVGGRWDGVLTGGPGHDRNNPAPLNANGLRGNVLAVSELLAAPDAEKRFPLVVLTPDGQWHARREPLSFGVPDDGTPAESVAEWRQRVRALLAQYPAHLVVGVDCHH